MDTFKTHSSIDSWQGESTYLAGRRDRVSLLLPIGDRKPDYYLLSSSQPPNILLHARSNTHPHVCLMI